MFRNKFDFEVGYLIKSPCRECKERKTFPICIDECNILDSIQNILAEGISCTKN